MTPLESKFLQHFGIGYLEWAETLSIAVFFYGASSSLAVCASSTSSVSGVFVVLFSASVVIFVFVSCKSIYFLATPDPRKLDRRKGFSNRTTAVMFVATVVNFLLYSLNTGTQVAAYIVLIRKALILDIAYSLSENPGLVYGALRHINVVMNWSGSIPVSLYRCWISHSFMLGGDMDQRPRCHLEGLGPLPRSTVDCPHTICAVDRNRG